VSILLELDKIRDDLAARFPGWQIWYVPGSTRTVTWCARPWPLVNSPSPERLAFDIRNAHAGGDWPALVPPGQYEERTGP